MRFFGDRPRSADKVIFEVFLSYTSIPGSTIIQQMNADLKSLTFNKDVQKMLGICFKFPILLFIIIRYNHFLIN